MLDPEFQPVAPGAERGPVAWGKSLANRAFHRTADLILRVGAKVGQIKLAKSDDTQAAEVLSLADRLVTEAMELTKQAQTMVKEGALGYCLIIAEKA